MQIFPGDLQTEVVVVDNENEPNNQQLVQEFGCRYRFQSITFMNRDGVFPRHVMPLSRNARI